MNQNDATTGSRSCRFCGNSLTATFVDLGMSPLCQTHVDAAHLGHREIFYPLHAYVCDRCFLVQLGEFATPEEIFTEYAYFSSYSESWLKHCEAYCNTMRERFHLDHRRRVFEIASNDGYLLQYFVRSGVEVLGIEPAQNVAAVARSKGVPTISQFLGEQAAEAIVAEFGQADLVLGNNVLAHVPNLNDFVEGMRVLLKPDGVITMEFPHLVELMSHNQFDTIYHEHFSYLSFTTVEKVFAAHRLTLFDVEKLSTHGGSIRIYARHSDSTGHTVMPSVQVLKEEEGRYGITRLSTYADFEQRVNAVKRDILDLLISIKRKGKSIAGYGAPGKGNTLLNYCGIRTDLLDFTVDRNPYKQGKYTPGTHIPIHDPAHLKTAKPDYVFILPWNLKDEIVSQHGYIREWGGQFIVPIPQAVVLP
jgi:SAM-dependent methyltransferase